MKSPVTQENGIVAIFDALGTASYSDADVESFMKSRSKVIDLLKAKTEGVLDISNRILIFTFNDTFIVALRCEKNVVKLDDIVPLFKILRKFLVDSMQERILFRGSVSIGSFYANEQENIIMGQTITDAVSWYDKADWIGVHATPHATIIIQQLLEYSDDKQEHLLLDYEIPLKCGKTVKAKAVNWPKVFYVKGISPCREKKRAKLLEFLSFHQIPMGSESKYYNTISFFEYAVKKYKEELKRRK